MILLIKEYVWQKKQKNINNILDNRFLYESIFQFLKKLNILYIIIDIEYKVVI